MSAKSTKKINQSLAQGRIALFVKTGLLSIPALVFLSACGSSSHSTVTDSPTAATLTNGTLIDPALTSTTATGQAQCNQFSATGGTLTGKVTSVYIANTLQEDKVRVRFTGIDATFTSNSATYIQFFRWNADTNGKTSIDSAPLQFSIEAGTSSSSPIANASGLTSLSYTQLVSIAAKGGVSGSSAVELLNRLVFVVNGVDYSWQVLKIVMYNGSGAVATADLLLPVFLANPESYAANHPGVLEALHPFNSQRSTTTHDDATWASYTNNFCF